MTTALLGGNQKMRPASPKAELWSAAHSEHQGQVWRTVAPNRKQAKKTLIINYLSTNVMLRKNEIIQKTPDCD